MFVQPRYPKHLVICVADQLHLFEGVMLNISNPSLLWISAFRKNMIPDASSGNGPPLPSVWKAKWWTPK